MRWNGNVQCEIFIVSYSEQNVKHERIIGNIKAVLRVLSQKQNRKNEINNSKDIKGIPNKRFSNTKHQTTTMIKSCMSISAKFFLKPIICVNCMNIFIFPYPVTNNPIWGKVLIACIVFFPRASYICSVVFCNRNANFH